MELIVTDYSEVYYCGKIPFLTSVALLFEAIKAGQADHLKLKKNMKFNPCPQIK